MKKLNTRNYGKSKFAPWRGYEEGGDVEDDDYDKTNRAGNEEYGVSPEGKFQGAKDPYKKEEERSPPDTKDQNIVLPRGILDDYFDNPEKPRKA